jgi:hypothetical protein
MISASGTVRWALLAGEADDGLEAQVGEHDAARRDGRRDARETERGETSRLEVLRVQLGQEDDDDQRRHDEFERGYYFVGQFEGSDTPVVEQKEGAEQAKLHQQPKHRR